MKIKTAPHRWLDSTPLAFAMRSLTAAAMLGACTLPAQQTTPNIDTRYLGPLKVMPPPGRVFKPTPRQFKLPAAAFVADGQDLVSTNSAFKIRLGPSLATADAVSITTPSPAKELLRLQPTGLSFYDIATGTNVLIAEIKPGHARLVSSNRVVFADCWDDVKASVSYTLHRNGFSQCVELNGPLPDPGVFGLNQKTTRLQVWSEVREAPEPKLQERVLKEILPGIVWKDETLVFSNHCRMKPGKAFVVGGLTNSLGQTNAIVPASPVSKQWRTFGTKTYLIEEIEFLPLAPELQKLPVEKKEGVAVSQPLPTRRLASAQPQLPALPTAVAHPSPTKSTQVQVASAKTTPGTLVIDYELTYEGYLDEDNDGLPDEWEWTFFGVLDYGPWDNLDGEALFYAFYYGTHPYNSDTDGDGTEDVNDPSPLVPSTVTDTVWIEDSYSVPTNYLEGTWEWFDNGNYPTPIASSEGHSSTNNWSTNENTHGFTNHPSPMAVATGDVLVAYAYIPPGQVPNEIMLQWHVNDTNGWNHRAYWGTEFLGLTNSYQASASLFNQGYWIRLEIPAANVALEGKSVDGMRFTLVGNAETGGEVLWDHIGVKHGATDTDGDGLLDWREMQLGTDLHFPDSDYDGISDGQEVADGTDPMNAADFIPRRLGYWKFNTSAFVGEQGQMPFNITSVSNAPSWSSNALATTTNLYSGLMYREYETNGAANINCQNGTVRLWFKPNWASTNQGGQGPGTYSRLIELGYYNQPLVGHWAFGLNPAGTVLWFYGLNANDIPYANFGCPISWASNEWHQITLTYTTTNSLLYLDGQFMNTDGGGVKLLDASLRSVGFRVGFDAYAAWSNGHFEELETFNYPLSSTTISNEYQQAILTYDLDGDGLTGQQEAALGTDPWKPSYLSTNNIYNLRVFTPLK